MTVRLTANIREQIKRAALEHKFGPLALSFVDEMRVLAADAYDDIYSKKDQALMESLPDGWLPTTNAIDVKMGSGDRFYTSIRFNGTFSSPVFRTLSEIPEPVSKRTQSRHKWGCIKAYNDQDPLAIRFQAISDKISAMDEKFREAEVSLGAALNSVTTLKRLIEVWPEVEPFTKKFTKAPAALPALPTQHLNTILDLPVA